jgi:hypothetical protein
MQRFVHRKVLGAALDGKALKPPAALRLLDAMPLLQRLPARVVGLGIRREHIRSPKA